MTTQIDPVFRLECLRIARDLAGTPCKPEEVLNLAETITEYATRPGCPKDADGGPLRVCCEGGGCR